MIKPYTDIVNSLAGKVADLGLLLIKDNGHLAAFSDGVYQIKIEAERYDSWSVSLDYIDDAGFAFSWGMLQQMLDPKQYAADRSEFGAIRNGNHDGENTIDANAPAILSEHGFVRRLSQLLGFLMAHRELLLSKITLFSTVNGDLRKTHTENMRRELMASGFSVQFLNSLSGKKSRE